MKIQTRQKIQHLLRVTHLLPLAEKVLYLRTLVRIRAGNRRFVAAHPDFKLPPKDVAYDAYSAPDWNFYKTSGEEAALYLADLMNKYLPGREPLRVLEWGCGPARVVRHIPGALQRASRVYGSDYNPASIAWCQRDIPQVTFSLNQLDPPLPFEGDSFDFIYSISVLTHLSEAVCKRWLAELYRVLSPGGVLTITTIGDSFVQRMLPPEVANYQSTGMLVRDGVEEGKRCFLAVHSPAYARAQLFSEFEVLNFEPSAFPYTTQDVWVLRKPA